MIPRGGLHQVPRQAAPDGFGRLRFGSRSISPCSGWRCTRACSCSRCSGAAFRRRKPEGGKRQRIERQRLVDLAEQRVQSRAGARRNRHRAGRLMLRVAQNAPGQRRRVGFARESRSAILFSTRICGVWSAPISCSVAITCAVCSGARGELASTTCSSSSASTTSSSVARNAFTSVVGRLRMKPTVR